MNPRVAYALVLLGMTPLAGAADEPAKLSCIKDITYSQEFLAKYPNAPAACREVVVKDGQKWARFDASVVKVKGQNVTANFIDNYNQTISTLTFAASRDARVTVDGKDVKYSSLQQGDTLSFWVPESAAGFYAKPGAMTNQKLALVSDNATKR